MRTFAFVGMVTFSIVAVADFEGPLLSRTLSPGHVPEPQAIASQCVIYPNHIRQEKRVGGGLRSTERRSVRVDVDGVNDKISQAERGTLSVTTGPTDIAEASYEAIQIRPDGTPVKVILSKTGSKNVKNPTRAAAALKNFIDLNCN